MRIVTEEVTLEGVEHLLRLYREPRGSDSSEFSRIIKTFLLDEMHRGKKPGTMAGFRAAILAYFDRNDSPINIRFDPAARYDPAESGSEMSLEDVFQMLTLGRPTVLGAAVVLAKLHRGLDSSTLADQLQL